MSICGTQLLSRRILAIATVLASFIFPLTLHAQLLVDCSGSNPSAYPSINAALPNTVPGSSIIVTGTCNENVTLQGANWLNIGAWWGQTATVNGTISINNSTYVYLYGLNMASPTGDGVSVSSSRSVYLDTCTSNGNAGVGLRVSNMSDVSVITMGSFDNNANGGINLFGNSFVTLGGWGGLIDISNNTGPGVWSSQASFTSLGHTTIANNQLGPQQSAGLGMQLYGGSRFQMGALFGPNILQGNPAGGAAVAEGSEISFWSAGPANVIQGNGPTGVSVTLGSQATFASNADITNHTDAGVDVYANSQANFFGTNKVQSNGSTSNARSAGIRVDGNSEAVLRGGDVSQNNGPALLALVNSSFDFTGVTFSGNSAGIITCDSTSTMISDLAGPTSTPPPGVHCKTPHGLGNHQASNAAPAIPDLTAARAMQAKYRKVATKP
jgi:parallel beta helix pectate lyase-like protein